MSQFSTCKKYFYELADELSSTHEIVGSCNHDVSLYLIPKGSIGELSYSSKPENSYRFSDHWNWYANVNKNPDENYIQCHNVDLPGPSKRLAPGKASKPVYGVCVAKFKDGKYHTVCGDGKKDRLVI